MIITWKEISFLGSESFDFPGLKVLRVEVLLFCSISKVTVRIKGFIMLIIIRGQ